MDSKRDIEIIKIKEDMRVAKVALQNALEFMNNTDSYAVQLNNVINLNQKRNEAMLENEKARCIGKVEELRKETKNTIRSLSLEQEESAKKITEIKEWKREAGLAVKEIEKRLENCALKATVTTIENDLEKISNKNMKLLKEQNDFATRVEQRFGQADKKIDHLEKQINLRADRLETIIHETKNEPRGEVNTMKNELRSEINIMKNEMKNIMKNEMKNIMKNEMMNIMKNEMNIMKNSLRRIENNYGTIADAFSRMKF